MAKQESKSLPAKRRAKRPDPRIHARREGYGLLLGAILACLCLSTLLTVDLFPTGRAPFGGRVPQEGEIADRSYKAPSDLVIPDRKATDELRRVAAAQSPAVYDFDERRLAALRERMRAAFAAAHQTTPTDATEQSDEASPTAAFRAALGEDYVLSDAALEVLAASGFRAEDERSILNLVSGVVGGMIVDDPAQFRRQAENRVVVVRELSSGQERRLAEPTTVPGLEEARGRLEERADRLLASRPADERRALLELAEALVHPNTTFNLRATEERRQAAQDGVKQVTVTLRKGEIVVRDGDPINARHVLILNGIRDQARTGSQIETFLGVAAVLGILMVVLWRFASSGIASFPRETRDAFFMLTVLVGTALGTRLALFLCDSIAERPELVPLLPNGTEPLYFVVPIAAAAMMVRMIYSAETAALFAVLAAVVGGLQVRGEVSYALFTLVGSLTAALAAARVTQRGTLMRAGLRVGLANVTVIGGLALTRGSIEAAPTILAMLLGLLSGILSGILVSGVAPVVETLFGFTTDVKLLELSNREQEVLRELEVRAPGTYHHSMMVGHLAEKAAEAIGANALLAKVAGYYHDIGKMRRPHFFVENFAVHGGINRHEKLSPSMSARIIQAHVKDGLEIGRDYKLARPIMNGIAQHHGTSIIRFFFEKAKELMDPVKGDAVEEHDYRYPGPKPQTREAGILMLADSVEAASRTLVDTSSARIQQLVQRLINNYFRDGQLDECSLTLRDLHAIARSFIDTLSAIRHERIDYPEATDAEGRRLEESQGEGVVERLEPRQKDRPERAKEDREDDIRRLGLP
jgi:putative nucleotidyltransferase with HDIG domain